MWDTSITLYKQLVVIEQDLFSDVRCVLIDEFLTSLVKFNTHQGNFPPKCREMLHCTLYAQHICVQLIASA